MTSGVHQFRVMKPLAAAAVAILSITVLAGCSSAGSTTCDQYAAKSMSDQQKTEMDLLSEHNLKTLDVGNTMGIMRDLTAYCGITGMGNEKATRNNSSPIDNAVNWSSKTW